MTALGPAAFVAEARRWKLDGVEPDWPLSTQTEQTEALLREMRGPASESGLAWHRRQGRDEDSGVYATALLLAVLAAGQRRVRRYCEHVEDRFIFRQELVVMLTPGAVVCRRCAPLMLPPYKREDLDDRCDLCDRRSDYFREYVFPLGGCVVGVNACDACSEWMMRHVGGGS